MSTAAQIVSNQLNSQKSTGPRTAEGKKRAALNSTRHGFTGLVVMLTAEESEPYRLFNEAFMSELRPTGATETQLVHGIIDGNWRINQLQATESAVYALGHREYIDQFGEETPETASAMARALTFKNEKQELDRLHRYQSRIQRQLNKDVETLRLLQLQRAHDEKKRAEQAIRIHNNFKKQGQNWNPADFGFVWSNAEIEQMSDRETRIYTALNPERKSRLF